MRNICEAIAKQFYKWKIINEDDINPLRFAFEVIITQVITFASLIGIGIYINQVTETFVYVIGFILLRRYIQGYHAKTFLLCYIFTMLNYIIVMILCQYIPYLHLFNIGIIILLIIIFKNAKKIEINKIILITCIYSAIIIGMYMLKEYKWIDICTLAYFSVLLMRWIGGNDDEDSSC